MLVSVIVFGKPELTRRLRRASHVVPEESEVAFGGMKTVIVRGTTNVDVDADVASKV